MSITTFSLSNNLYRIEDTSDLCGTLTKRMDEDIDKDSLYLEEQLKILKNVSYEKDYWKELELKSIIGDEIIKLEIFQKDCDENWRITRERFENMMRDFRRLIDKLNFVKIIEILNDLMAPAPPNSLPIIHYTMPE